MSTQKAKFELFSRLQAMGFTYDESAKLRRIEMTLQRWAEMECGTGGGQTTHSIERDDDHSMVCTQCGHKHYGEDALFANCPKCGDPAPLRRRATGKPYHRVQYPTANGYHDSRYPIADREAGALRRLAAIMARHPDFVSYHQGDCRGCMLYILRKSDVNGSDINQVYNRGLAVCD